MKKRGLSTIITQILLILLVLVAVGFLMTVIRSTIAESSDSVEGNFELLNIDLDIVSVVDNGASIDVKVRRDTGKGELRSLKFEISDGMNSQTIEEIGVTLEELGTGTYNLAYPGLVKEISVHPVVRVESGKEKTGNVADTMTFTNKQVIQNLGGVSWYKMDGDARDELGFAPGTINSPGGNIDCNVQGQHGQACSFGGVVGDSITTGKDRSEFFGVDEGTMMAWVRPTGGVVADNNVFNLPAIIKDNSDSIGIYVGEFPNPGINGIWFHNFAPGTQRTSFSYNVNTWIHVAWVHEGGNLYAYQDGLLDNAVTNGDTFPLDDLIEIGTNSFDGEIDELMIFGKGLNADEVDDLSNLDLS